jgi:hypothetical protein
MTFLHLDDNSLTGLIANEVGESHSDILCGCGFSCLNDTRSNAGSDQSEGLILNEECDNGSLKMADRSWLLLKWYICIFSDVITIIALGMQWKWHGEGHLCQSIFLETSKSIWILT